MTTGILEALAPEPVGAVAGNTRSAAGEVRRLVPFSGLQFLEIEIDARVLPMSSFWFTEERIDGPEGTRRVLLPLSSDQATDGMIFHPVTFRPLGPDDMLSYSGLEAIEPFLDQWTPLPFLRYLGRSEGGLGRFDQGPFNWARIFIERPAAGLRGAERLKAVLAFDTRLDTASRADALVYLAPNTEDALFASTFIMVDEPEHLSGLLSQGWMDIWLRELARSGSVATPKSDVLQEEGFAAREATAERFELAHLGRYLALLKVLGRAAALPHIRFVDSVSKSLPVPAVGLDLIVDLGSTETTALLVPHNQPPGPDFIATDPRSIRLRLRDLGCPTRVHDGPIPTLVEFDHQTFGNAACSRRSGRPDAFAWTSLVRIGSEAQRLALRSNAVDGLTGGIDVSGRIADTAASEVIWRFSTPDATLRSGPMVTGETMRHVSEDGELLQRPDGLLTDGTGAQTAAVPAMRPRFSQSALVGFFLVELLFHALSEINSADPSSPFGAEASERNEVRRIERIVVTSPLAMPARERQLLVERFQNAIDLVWRTQKWDASSALPYPPKPEVGLSIGADVGMQLVHLYSEVRTKFGGSFSELVDCVRRRAGDIDARDNLRIGSMEIGRRTLGLTIIDYDVSHDGSVDAGIVTSDRAVQGGARVIDAIAEQMILAALEQRLNAAGLPDAHQFLMALSEGRTEIGGLKVPSHLGKRLEGKLLRPAATHLFDHYAKTPRRTGRGLSRTRLGALALAGGGRLDPAAGEFDDLVATAGAKGFAIGAVWIESSRRQFERLLEIKLWPAIDAMSEAVRSADSDLLLIGGELAGIPDIVDRLLVNSPVPPGRISVLDPPGATSKTGSGANPSTAASTRMASVLGAYMASRNLLAADGFALATRGVADALTLDGATQRTLLRSSADRSTRSAAAERVG